MCVCMCVHPSYFEPFQLNKSSYVFCSWGGAGSHVAQAFLELSMKPRMTLNIDPPFSTSGMPG